MSFQSAVALQQGFGVPGELFCDAPHKAESFTIRSASAAYNIIGATCCTVTSEGIAAAGGTNPFAGFLATPKVYALQGTTSGTLTPTLVLPNETQVELVTMGSLIVTLPAAAAIGDLVVYDNTTGAISTITPSAALPVGTTFANAKVDYFTVTGAGLAVITINPTFKIPVLA